MPGGRGWQAAGFPPFSGLVLAGRWAGSLGTLLGALFVPQGGVGDRAWAGQDTT